MANAKRWRDDTPSDKTNPNEKVADPERERQKKLQRQLSLQYSTAEIQWLFRGANASVLLDLAEIRETREYEFLGEAHPITDVASTISYYWLHWQWRCTRIERGEQHDPARTFTIEVGAHESYVEMALMKAGLLPVRLGPPLPAAEKDHVVMIDGVEIEHPKAMSDGAPAKRLPLNAADPRLPQLVEALKAVRATIAPPVPFTIDYRKSGAANRAAVDAIVGRYIPHPVTAARLHREVTRLVEMTQTRIVGYGPPVPDEHVTSCVKLVDYLLGRLNQGRSFVLSSPPEAWTLYQVRDYASEILRTIDALRKAAVEAVATGPDNSPKSAAHSEAPAAAPLRYLSVQEQIASLNLSEKDQSRARTMLAKLREWAPRAGLQVRHRQGKANNSIEAEAGDWEKLVRIWHATVKAHPTASEAMAALKEAVRPAATGDKVSIFWCEDCNTTHRFRSGESEVCPAGGKKEMRPLNRPKTQ